MNGSLVVPLFLPAAFAALVGCAGTPQQLHQDTMNARQSGAGLRFLALGDSYTIGEAVKASERWPVQLAAMLRADGLAIAEPLIIATTGWTTRELMDGIAQQAPRGPFDLVSLQIGVNNQYRGRDLGECRSEFRTLLRQAIGFAGGHPERVLVVSIPDWGVTPFAAGRDRSKIATEIDSFNEVNREEAGSAGVHTVDITPASRKAAVERTLIAEDGLHPSGTMYAEWARLIAPEILPVLKGLQR